MPVTEDQRIHAEYQIQEFQENYRPVKIQTLTGLIGSITDTIKAIQDIAYSADEIGLDAVNILTAIESNARKTAALITILETFKGIKEDIENNIRERSEKGK